VLGVEYFVGDVPAATATVLRRVESGLGGYSCLCGVHGIITAQHSESMMRALDGAWLNFPDGAPVAWLMRRHGAGVARRVAGPDLMPMVIEAGQEAGLRHFLFGSSPDVLERLEGRLLDRFPRAIIAGSISPPFREVTDAENERFAAQIVASGADIVWVGLGLPKQDEWLRRRSAWGWGRHSTSWRGRSRARPNGYRLRASNGCTGCSRSRAGSRAGMRRRTPSSWRARALRSPASTGGPRGGSSRARGRGPGAGDWPRRKATATVEP
jgi:exopolysaccharide biosynthesis WecB/TagA/CpsF family protein